MNKRFLYENSLQSPPLELDADAQTHFLMMGETPADFKSHLPLIRFYLDRFSVHDSVNLVLYYPFDSAMDLLIEWAEQLPDNEEQAQLTLIEEVYSEAQLPALFRACDVLLSQSPEQLEKVYDYACLGNCHLLYFGALPQNEYSELISASDISQRELQQLIAGPARSCERYLKRHRREILSTGSWELVYIPSPRHLEAMHLQSHQLVLTDYFSVGAQLATSRLFVYAQDLIDPAHYAEISQESLELCERWYQGFFEDIHYEGVALVETCQYDLWYCFRGLMLLQYVFQELQKQLSLSQLSLFEHFSTPQFWDPMGGPFPDAKNALLYALAENANLNVELLPPVQSFNYYHIPNPPQSATSAPLLAEFLIPEDKLHAELHRDKESGILALGSELDYREQELLQAAFQDSPYHYFYAKDHVFKTPSEQIHFDVQHCKYLSVQEQQQLHQEIQQAWQNFQSSSAPIKEHYPHLFENPRLHFQFQHFFHLFIEVAESISACKRLVEYLKPRLCLMGNPVGSAVKGRIHWLKSQNIPTLSVFHGASGQKPYHSPVDHLVVWNQNLKDDFIHHGYTQKISVIGDLRAPQNSAPLPSRKNHPTPESGQQICILTGIVDYGIYHLTASAGRLLESWRAFLEIMLAHPHWRVLIKPHPRYDYFDFYAELEARYAQISVASPFDSIADVAHSSQLGLMMGYPSTAIYEFLNLNVPLVYFDYAAQGYTENTTGLETISSLETLADTLAVYLQDETRRAQSIQDAQSLREKTSDPQGNARAFKALLLPYLEKKPERLEPQTVFELGLVQNAALSATLTQQPQLFQSELERRCSHYNIEVSASIQRFAQEMAQYHFQN